MRSTALILVLLAVLRFDANEGEGQRATGENAKPTGSAPCPAMLSELRKHPSRWLGQEVTFAVQFRRAVEDWNPYISRFGPREWLSFEAWPDEAFTWEAEVFADPATRLFVRRSSSPAELLQGSRPHARFEVHAFVREVFLGEPWLEIVELVPLDGEVGEGTILHVGRARELVAEGQWELALEQYERAKSAPLPPHALAALEREILATREAQELAAREEEQRH